MWTWRETSFQFFIFGGDAVDDMRTDGEDWRTEADEDRDPWLSL